MSDFADWIGREAISRDVLTQAKARRWLATFDLEQAESAVLPQGIHWCLCLPEAPTANLGEDGHPRRDLPGSLLPPIPFPRRMWAGSACTFFRPIRTGDPVERTTRIQAISEKAGRSGPLAFVTLMHETQASGELAVREEQTLVYREAPAADAPLSPAQHKGSPLDDDSWDVTRHLTPGLPLLFRYSALTFNTHRIHYDADYVRDVECYRGPVVHGPLMASLLLQLAASEVGNANRLTAFSFRGLSPAIADEELILALRGKGRSDFALGVFAGDGRPIIEASASYSSR